VRVKVGLDEREELVRLCGLCTHELASTSGPFLSRTRSWTSASALDTNGWSPPSVSSTTVLTCASSSSVQWSARSAAQNASTFAAAWTYTATVSGARRAASGLSRDGSSFCGSASSLCAARELGAQPGTTAD
jgi:hypothetical protein